MKENRIRLFYCGASAGILKTLLDLLKLKPDSRIDLDTAGSFEKGIIRCGNAKPDVLLVGAEICDENLARQIHLFRLQYPSLPIFVLSALMPVEASVNGLFADIQGLLDINTLNVEMLLNNILPAKIPADLKTTHGSITCDLMHDDLARLLDGVYGASKTAVVVWETTSGIVCYVNPSAKLLLNSSVNDITGKSFTGLSIFKSGHEARYVSEELERNEFIRFEHINLLSDDGTVSEVEMTLQKININSRDLIHCGIRSITERSMVLSKSKLISAILGIISESSNYRHSVRQILENIRGYTGVEAICLRLKEDDHFQIFESLGYQDDFMSSDNKLCAFARNSSSADMDFNGFPSAEQGNVNGYACVIPFLGQSSSFWRNNLKALTEDSYESKSLQHCIEHCVKAGYYSIAISPIRSGDKIIGLIQLNDSRKDFISYDVISLIEEVAGIIGIIFRKREDDIRIKESEDHLRVIVEATRDVIYRLNYTTMQYDYISPAIELLTGYSEAEINTLGFASIVETVDYPGGGNMSREEMRKRRENRQTAEFRADYLVRTKSAELKWISDHSHPWYDIEGRLMGSIGVLSDITFRKNAETELKKLKDEAEELSRLKTSFIDNMSHELRTPMIGILGYSEILQNELSDAYLKEMAEMIEHSGRRLLNTLNLILELSDLEAKKQGIYKSKIEFISLLKEILNNQTALTQKKSLKVKLHSELKNLSIFSNERMLMQIFDNLINNALKFTEHGGVNVNVSVEPGPPDYVVVKIVDTGIGIDAESREIIWEEFRQVSEGQNRNYQGAGLGLTITRKFVEKLSGTIELESIPGSGSTFIVRLPVSDTGALPADKRIASHLKTETANGSKGKDAKILVVDDDRITRNVIRTFLKDICEVDMAENGLSAIQKVKEKHYDAILLDINLGIGLNGLQTMAEIRGVSGMKSIPIAAVTAYAMKQDEENIMDADFDYYIAKPFRRDEFINFVKRVLGN